MRRLVLVGNPNVGKSALFTRLTGIHTTVSNYAGTIAPVVKNLWGLPESAILPIVMGFLRKDVAAGMLVPLHLSAPQLMTACVLLSLTFPCVATLAVLFSELGWRDTVKSVLLMLITSVLFGAVAHFLFQHIAG
jgi:ferrous iron transport protein B